MRETGTYGSMRGRAFPTGRPALLYTLVTLGVLFWHYAIATQADAASDTASDHPLSKERFENFVRTNAEKASTMGISVN